MGRTNRNGKDAVPFWVKRANEEKRSVAHKITWPVLLACQHTALYVTPIPAVGEQVYCRTCSTYQVVTEHPSMWRMRCRNCTLSRTAEEESEAYRAGSRHTMKNQAHTVDVLLGDELKGSVGAAEDALLPYEKETGDRLAAAQRGAQALKKMLEENS